MFRVTARGRDQVSVKGGFRLGNVSRSLIYILGICAPNRNPNPGSTLT